MSSVEKYELLIQSDTSAGMAVQERIINMLVELEYSARDVFGVRLALEEALVNAIKHGNGSDPNKRVRIGWRICSERMRVEIEDEGVGFDLVDVPDPTDEENIERPCGRGIMLMRAFMNVIEYNDRGNCVILEKIRGVPVNNQS